MTKGKSPTKGRKRRRKIRPPTEAGIILNNKLHDLFGSAWRTKLTNNIGKDYATLKRWLNGELAIPEYVTAIIELLEVILSRKWPDRWRPKVDVETQAPGQTSTPSKPNSNEHPPVAQIA